MRGKLVISEEYTMIDTSVFLLKYTIKKSIGFGSFMRCRGLTEIDFGSVQKIEKGAFIKRTGLTNVDFKRVKSIGEFAFL